MQQLSLFDNTPIITNTTPIQPADDELRHITLAGQSLPYRFKRSSKRRTIGLTIDEHGLAVFAPRWVAHHEIDAFINEKQKWVFKKLIEIREQHNRSIVPPICWQDGGSLPYLGQTLTLRLPAKEDAINGAPMLSSDATLLFLGLPDSAHAHDIKEHVQNWLKKQARSLFIQRLDHYAARLGVRYTCVSLSSATTRWGSCGEDGHIRLNWRLIHFSQNIIDYVVAHELSHLKEMNHGPRFWQTVASIFPEYDDARAALKQPLPAL